MFATRFKDTHLTITDTKIRFVTPDIAAVDAHWEMTGRKVPIVRRFRCARGY
jgi:hypothetical protein